MLRFIDHTELDTHTHTHTHTHKHTHGRTCLNWYLPRLGGRYLHNTRKRETYMPSADFEPAIPAI